MNLLVRLHITKGYRTGFNLIWTNNHAKRCAHLIRLLKLSLQRTTRTISLASNASFTQCQHGIKYNRSLISTCASNIHTAWSRRFSRNTKSLQRKHYALKANSKTNAWGWLSALKLNKTVITAAATDSANASVWNLYLKNSARVVIQTTNKRWILNIRNTCSVQIGLDLLIVSAAIIT